MVNKTIIYTPAHRTIDGIDTSPYIPQSSRDLLWRYYALRTIGLEYSAVYMPLRGDYAAIYRDRIIGYGATPADAIEYAARYVLRRDSMRRARGRASLLAHTVKQTRRSSDFVPHPNALKRPDAMTTLNSTEVYARMFYNVATVDRVDMPQTAAPADPPV